VNVCCFLCCSLRVSIGFCSADICLTISAIATLPVLQFNVLAISLRVLCFGVLSIVDNDSFEGLLFFFGLVSGSA